MSLEKIAIGIDLGTTHVRASVVVGGQPVAIPYRMGSIGVPCYVGFGGSEIYTGQEAKLRQEGNLCNTVFEIKRFIGRNFRELLFSPNLRTPFGLVTDHQFVKAEVNFAGRFRSFHQEEILGLLLAEAKDEAEAFIGKRVDSVVIGVPFHFSSLQRMAVRRAGELAGFDEVALANETSLAAIGLPSKPRYEHNVFIYDFGCSSTNASLIRVSGTEFQVLSAAGSFEVGGKDIDDILVDHCLESFEKTHSKRITKDPRLMFRLKEACGVAKCALTTASSHTIRIPSFFEGSDFILDISRHVLEELCKELLSLAFDVAKKALARSPIAKNAIDRVILVGGTNQIPIVYGWLTSFFGTKPSFATSGVIADGAALLAQAIFAAPTNPPVLKDIASFSIVTGAFSRPVQAVSVTSAGKVEFSCLRTYSFDQFEMKRLVPVSVSAPIPVSKLFRYPVDSDDHSFRLPIYEVEGDREPRDETYEYIIEACGIPPGETHHVDITYQVDASGIFLIGFQPNERYRLRAVQKRGPTKKNDTFSEIDAQRDILDGSDTEAKEHLQAKLDHGDLVAALNLLLKDKDVERRECLENAYIDERDWQTENQEATKHAYWHRSKLMTKLIQKENASYLSLALGGLHLD